MLTNRRQPGTGNRVKITDCAATVIRAAYEGRCLKSPTTVLGKKAFPEQDTD